MHVKLLTQFLAHKETLVIIFYDGSAYLTSKTNCETQIPYEINI